MARAPASSSLLTPVRSIATGGAGLGASSSGAAAAGGAAGAATGEGAGGVSARGGLLDAAGAATFSKESDSGRSGTWSFATNASQDLLSRISPTGTPPIAVSARPNDKQSGRVLLRGFDAHYAFAIFS